MFTALEQALLALIQLVPLHLFVFLGSFIEEVIAPIPSPAVMIAAGTAAAIQHYTPMQTALLSISGAIGKAAGAGVIYIIAYKLEDVITGRLGSFFGVNKARLDAFGEKLTGTWKDYFTLTAIRMAPFVPSAVVSIGSAIIKVPFTMFLITTFFGTIFRDGVYLYVGYTGTKVFGNFLSLSDNLESYLTAGAVVTVVLLVAYFVVKKVRAKTGMS